MPDEGFSEEVVAFEGAEVLLAGLVELIDRVELLAAGAVLFYDSGVLLDEFDDLV